jgi:hypothetical protein
VLDAKTDRNEPFQDPHKGVAAFVVIAIMQVVSDTHVLCVVGKTAGDWCCVCVRACCELQGIEPNKEKAIEELGSDFCTVILSNVGWCKAEGQEILQLVV